jgi:flagellar hook-basal body complex protein FliE
MISDVLFEATDDIRQIQAKCPESYEAVAKEVEIVLTVMQTLLRYLDSPPLHCDTMPDYVEKHDAIREAVRCLDVSEITAMRDVRSDKKRRRPSYLAKGAIVLGRAVDEIREYQQASSNAYKSLSEEIEVVVTVMTALQVYLDALAPPMLKFQDKLKSLGEALRQLDVDRCRSSMKELYDYFGTRPPQDADQSAVDRIG